MTIKQVIAGYGVPVRTPAQAAEFSRAAGARLGQGVPSALLRFAVAPGLARELARAYDAQVVFPDRVELAGGRSGAGTG